MDLIEQLAAGEPPWRHHLVRQGRLERGEAGSLRLVTEGATADAYSDAQIDDYGWPVGQPLLRRRPLRPGALLGAGPGAPLTRRPPLRLRVRARFSHEAGALRGTAGFGFWNYPVALPLGMPRAIWFFYGSPPLDMPLAMSVPGHGFKAATVDTGRPRALALAPLAPILVPLMRVPALYRGLWPPIQRAVGVAEALVRAPMAGWHDYVIEWGPRTSRFLVDGRVVLDEAPSPRGPMCFVAWIDNQYFVATPWGRFRWGTVAARGRQWLELAELVVAPMR
ncbi:MAG TPA: hypothetical protein PKD53_26150 [Chloroflexaceae bacterium]|nr:hypothetical protein [Chloroflexaceae bacterium]